VIASLRGKNPAVDNNNKKLQEPQEKTRNIYRPTNKSFSNCVNLPPGTLTGLQWTVYNLYLDMHMWIFDDHLMFIVFFLFFLFVFFFSVSYGL